MVDAMSLLCRALGQSADAQSYELLKRVSHDARSRKLRRWAESIYEQIEARRE
jgi:hypothetical protein